MMSKTMKAVVAALLCISLAACVTYPLSSSLRPTVPKTVDQQGLDVQECEDKAILATKSAADQVTYLLLGLTIIGVPIAWSIEKAKQRQVFADCMTARGYAVTPATD